ncbi:unnamed protein product, partial [Vitis vinifera]|uniref:Uncharacterized protein n=1 Tax=Vitis vinifera TaxID=29760 RepID=D7TAW3_VITVI
MVENRGSNITPSQAFQLRFNSVSSLSCSILFGIVPFIRLFDKSSLFIRSKFPIHVGIGPEMEFTLRSRRSKLVRC